MTILANLLVLIPLLATAQDVPPPPPPVVGHWKGTIEIADLRFDVDLARANGALVGDLSIPVQNLVDRALLDLSYDGTTLRFRIADVPGDPTFEGRFDTESDRVSGTFTQAGQPMPFAMQRGIDPRVALAGFDDWAEEQLERLRVPGLAVAVVLDGEVVHAAGYGRRDAAADLPVDADTLFAIGSTTKAFTTFALAQAAAEDLVDWDEPVRTYLPSLRLVDPVAEQQLTLRDMCSHRSGLPRHDLVWYANPDESRAELVRRLAHLEPSAGFRERWQYNNLMFAAAGLALERVSGDSWEAWTRARILEPLGMSRTCFGRDEALADPNSALPHDRRRGRTVAVDMRDLAQIGPAGSIHSSANDMARWIALQLGRGSTDGATLLDPAAHAELMAPVVALPNLPTLGQGPKSYALGWMVDERDGHVRVHHGGGIDGFTTQVELYPEDGLGIFTTTNRASSLTTIAADNLAERFLGLPQLDRAQIAAGQLDTQEELRASMDTASRAERIPDAPHARPLSTYAAVYAHPGYGEVVVSEDAEGLRARYGFIEAPLEHWHFEVFRCAEAPSSELFEGLLVHFRDDRDGLVQALEVALENSAEPIVFERQPDARLLDPTLVDGLVGRYRLMLQDLRVERGAGDVPLRLVVPGQPTYDLVPATHGRFALAGLEGFHARFDPATQEEPATLVLFQPNGIFRATRVEEEE